MRPSRVLATWFGAGLVPLAPGTAGTLAAIPAYVLLGRFAPPLALPAAALAVSALGVVVAGREAEASGISDPQHVVIDEVAGYLVACCFGPFGWITGAAAFVLFRALDILKPGPIDRLQHVHGGWGIMLDDLAAGHVAGLVILLGWGALGGRWTGALATR